jgi:hypothetical protein
MFVVTQVLVMSIIEAGFFVLNSHIGYKLLGVVDVGKQIEISVFSSFFSN